MEDMVVRCGGRRRLGEERISGRLNVGLNPFPSHRNPAPLPPHRIRHPHAYAPLFRTALPPLSLAREQLGPHALERPPAGNPLSGPDAQDMAGGRSSSHRRQPRCQRDGHRGLGGPLRGWGGGSPTSRFTLGSTPCFTTWPPCMGPDSLPTARWPIRVKPAGRSRSEPSRPHPRFRRNSALTPIRVARPLRLSG